jgi:hypothetical protein
MIKVMPVDERYVPMLFCDFCGERILDASMALIRYKSDPSDPAGTEVLYAHKNTCDKQLKDVDSGWGELRTFLTHLTSNVGFPAKDMYEADAQRKEMGFPEL